jgi:hypothetical protein
MSEHNEHLLNRLAGIQQSLIAHHAGGAGFPSNAVGNERETFLREFLRKVFPSGTFSFSGFKNTAKTRPEKVDVPFFNGLQPSSAKSRFLRGTRL